ncbi:MAG: copper amine oxidase N-terminal domain-containing protein [Defluviitaleaceae bacterium]|nr:copper amine oxidase N-terminal domain-containing protein [Defluviitaleaceae bacterium]
MTFQNNGATQTNDVAPFIDPATDRAMLPLRLIAETIGGTVDWNEATATVTITTATATLVVNLNEPLPGDMGNVILQNGRTFVPVRYIVENLGLSVEWDGETGSINITR